MMEALTFTAARIAAEWSAFWFPLAAKATIVLLGTGLVSLALRRSAAATRHLIWTAGMLGVLFLPVLIQLTPDWRVSGPFQAAADPVPVTHTEFPTKTAVEAASVKPLAVPVVLTETSAVPLHMWAFFLWETGTLVAFAWIGLGLLQLRNLRRRSVPLRSASWSTLLHEAKRSLGLHREVRLLRSLEADGPVTWGVGAATLLLPAECERWDPEKRWHVLLHELAHVRRRDFLTQLLAQTACALHWFNPLAWIGLRQMRRQRERACDDLVLAQGARPSTYAGDLLELSTSLTGAGPRAAMSMARCSRIGERVKAVLDPARRRAHPSRQAIVAFSVAGLALAIPLAAVTADAEPQSSGDPRTSSAEAAVAIKAQLERFMEAIEDEDLDVLADLYTEDAEIYPPDGSRIRGRARILDYWEEAFDLGIGDLGFRTEEVLQTGDTAVEIGRFRSYQPAGSMRLRGRYMAVWAREVDGEWRVQRDLANVAISALGSTQGGRVR